MAPNTLNLPTGKGRLGATGADPVYLSREHLSEPQMVRGLQEILAFRASLMRLSERCGQYGAAQDLEYFLTIPYAFKKQPCLLLFRSQEVLLGTGGDLCGAVLLFQYKIAGVGTRIFSTGDMTGRRSVIAPASARAGVAASAARWLFSRGARACLISFQQAQPATETLDAADLELRGIAGITWAIENRKMPVYLPLHATFDETLARIGQRTRSNLRYYRRRTERELGCTFIPKVDISLNDFLAFNRRSTYAVSDGLARWRLASLEVLTEPFFEGLKDRDGHWLALVCGRRWSRNLEIDWQMNRADLPAYSLSTVMRAYLIEHEIARGSEWLSIEGGTPHPIQQSFLSEASADLTVLRDHVHIRAIRRLLGKRQSHKNYLLRAATDPKLTWHRG